MNSIRKTDSKSGQLNSTTALPISTQSPNATSSLVPSAQTNQPNDIVPIVLSVLIPFTVIVVCLLLYLYFRYRKRESRQDKKGGFSVEGILDKVFHYLIFLQRYICIVDYEPAADDELKLRIGDTVVLELLFNDGWGKGKNSKVYVNYRKQRRRGHTADILPKSI